MAHLGGYTAVTEEQRAGLLAQPTDRDKLVYLQNEITEPSFRDIHLDQPFHTVPSVTEPGTELPLGCIVEKAWIAMHVALAEIAPGSDEGLDMPDPGMSAFGSPPLNAVVLGPARVFEDEKAVGHICRLIAPGEITPMVEAMDALTDEAFEARYWANCEGCMPAYDEHALEYTREHFRALADFLRGWRGQGRWIVFDADW